MSIVSDIIRQHTDTIILSSLNGRDSYGYEINKKIKLCTGGRYELNEATLYTAFKRLEDGGCINSYWGTGAAGARRKYYRLTDYGAETLNRLTREWQDSKEIIDKLLEKKGEEI